MVCGVTNDDKSTGIQSSVELGNGLGNGKVILGDVKCQVKEFAEFIADVAHAEIVECGR